MTYSDHIKNPNIIHPKFQFCGSPEHSLLNVPDNFLKYILSILKNDPILPPSMLTLEQWEEALSILNMHHIMPTLYRIIGMLPEQYHPPESVLHLFRQSFLNTRGQAIQTEILLNRITSEFQKRGIRVIILKGPALSHSIYPDSAMRSFSDIDLLIHPDDVLASRHVLKDLGYDCVRTRFEKFKSLWDHELYINRVDQQKNRAIEVHWDLHRFSTLRPEKGIDALFAEAVKVETPYLTFEMLNPVDALIHRAINNAFVHFKDMRLTWIYDVKLLAEHLKVPQDWRLLQKKCVFWNARLALEHSLNLAQIWTGLIIPRKFADFSKWPQPKRRESSSWEDLIQRYHKPSHLIKLLKNDPAPFSEKIRFFIHTLFPPEDFMKSYYSPDKTGSVFFSHIRRWFKWFSGYIG